MSALALRASVSAVVCLAPRAVRAQDAASDAVSASEALIRHGVELRRAGDDEAALAEFHRAYELSATPRALVQIAMAEQALGHWIDADAHLREGLRAVDDPWVRENSDALRGPLEVIGHHLGSLDVHANIPGAELWIDGHLVGTLPLAAPVRRVTGTAVIELRLAGYQRVRRSVEIEPDALARETFALVPLPTEPDPAPTASSRLRDPPPSTARENHSIAAGPLSLLGAGALGFVAAGVFYGLRQNSIRHCTTDPTNPDRIVCDTSADALEAQDGRTYTTLTNVALVSGAVVAAAGLTWLVSQLRHTPPAASSARTVFVAPSPDGVLFGLRGAL